MALDFSAPPVIHATPDPAARSTDPATSHQAAAAAKELQARHHRLILAALEQHGPMGKDGIASRTNLTAYQVGKRLTELGRVNAIRLTGRTVPSIAGRQEREWEVV